MSSGELTTKELGSYQLINQIAVGGMAEIYLAKTEGVAGFEKFLCLKVLHPDLADDDEFIEMLIDEAKLVVGLNHVNICQIFDLGRQGDTYYIAMEYVDGADLFKMMRSLSEQDIDVPIDVAAYVAQEICTGLDYAHRKKDAQGRPLGIIHRDISPQNILISHWGEVKIIDFGIAKAATQSKKTQAGVIKGKYYYMSPEQAWGDQVDHRSDIFSAGIILYEVLTGQMLYLEEDVSKLMNMVRRAEIPRPTRRRPDIPPQLENVVMKALAKAPEDRWQSANDFQVALTSFLYSYSPDFTPERLASVLKQGTDWDEAEELDVEELDDDDIIFHVEEEQLLSRVDVPVSQDSVIFDASAYRASLAAEEEEDEEDDFGQTEEKTTVSAMPDMMDFGPAPEAAVVAPPGGSFDQWDEDGPTQVASAAMPQQPSHDMAPEHLEDEPPEEVVVGQAQVVMAPGAALRPAVEAGTQEKTLPPSLVPEPEYGASPLDPTEPAHRLDPASLPTGQPPQATSTPPDQRPQGDASLAPREPAYPSQVQPPSTSPQQGWHSPNTPSSNPGTAPPIAAEDSDKAPNQTYSGGAFAQRLAANTPPNQAVNTPPNQQAPLQPDPSPVPAPVSAPAAMPPSTQAPAPSGRVPTMALDPTVPAAPAPGYPPPQNPQAPGFPPQQSMPSQPGVGGSAEMDPSLAQVSLQPRSHRLLKVFLILVMVGAVLAGAGTGLFWYLNRPEQATIGYLEVVSVPEGAKVDFAGNAMEQVTPVTFPVKDLKKSHKVVVNLKGFQPWTEQVSFPDGYSRLRVLAVLTPVYGKVLLRSKPTGATIYIKGEAYGQTPATVENLSTQEDLTVELRLKGYQTATRTVRWEDKSQLEVEIPLDKDR